MYQRPIIFISLNYIIAAIRGYDSVDVQARFSYYLVLRSSLLKNFWTFRKISNRSETKIESN